MKIDLQNNNNCSLYYKILYNFGTNDSDTEGTIS